MRDINTINLTGRITAKPELQTTANGKKLCKFNIAVADNDTTYFFAVTVWNKQAEAVEIYCDKGHKVGIVGKLTMNDYEVNGNKRRSHDIVANEVVFLEPKKSIQGEAESGSNEGKQIDSIPYVDSTYEDLPY